ncbi:LodA/GoxA family CTQ-dependent oxidase [Paraburkholderia hospita]|uniref:LodA/GoxA family CTQ-dependent oxidase n=1 Tax=Paraburkholderia hospita TaxID=169430 RepID=UPI000271B66B|nr:LodA/GoxA family CTQ-dependent oxidase [Paraburkholderia hospita]EUC12351.1 Catalase domain protein [Burkholderia sp. BT03]SKC51948.1 hypothetical protein SAMN06266956_0475 [Paraburkholderia hospita]
MAVKTGDGSEPALNCETDPIGSLKTMFVDMVMGRRLAQGQNPVRRPVFLKPHGIAQAEFVVRSDLPPELQVGLFADGRSYLSWIRISSDTISTLPDVNTTLGIGIKLFGVGGRKLVGKPEDQTFDLVLQNHDVFFADTATDMCAFTRATLNGLSDKYLAAHPVTDAILKDMQKNVSSALTTTYWSVLPYAFGTDRFVKYKLEPETSPDGTVDQTDPNYLSVDLNRRLLSGEARFRFLVQFQTTEAEMPLDRATVRWGEESSRPIHLATLVIAKQDTRTRGQAEYGDNLAINPWRVTETHAPVGSIANARRVVYAASADLRRSVNGVPDGEPFHPRGQTAYPPPRDSIIVSAKIHPAIGIARVGNAQTAYFIGPELSSPPSAVPGDRRDVATGALKRQAARFRIYGYNEAGEVVAELTPASAKIEWQVQLANLKASWYQFQIALDIPEADGAPPSLRRNKDADPSILSITAPPQKVSGADAAAAVCEGLFNAQPVYLGEIRTDSDGRLIVLGGRGATGSLPGAVITNFANNDGWHDDVSDGPVTATASIAGREIPVDPAWVVVAPPNYAPDLKGVRTAYDLIRDVFIDAGSLELPQVISFSQDVLPIFERLAGLQWVNNGYAGAFGHGGTHDVLSPSLLEKLGDAADENKAFRYEVFNMFRDFDKDGWSPALWPWLYGDAVDIPFAPTPRQNTMLAKHQIFCLKRWAEGKFTSDFPAGKDHFSAFDDVPLDKQPEMLDRAALDFCLADAFHPGCEMTWPMRHATMYMAPFRIRHRRGDEQLYPIGDALSPVEARATDGPLFGQRAGWITRWMAVPWHTDTASCRSQAAYDPTYNPFVPTFWPARVPNQVLTEDDYAVVLDTARPRAERIAAFRRRKDWNDLGLGTSHGTGQIVEMIRRYGAMGLVEAREGFSADPDLPATIYVTDGKPPPEPPAPPVETAAGATLQVNTTFIERLGDFPFGPKS